MASPRPASLARRALPALAVAGLSGALLVRLDHPASPAAASAAADEDGPGAAPGPSSSDDDETLAAPAASADDDTDAGTDENTDDDTDAGTSVPAPGATRRPPAAGAARPAAPATPAAPTTPASTTAPVVEPVPAPAAPADPTSPTEPAAAPDGGGAACDAEPVAGPTVDTRWGPVQVAAVFTGDGVLCDVQVLQYPDDHRKSVTINARALPVLRRQALATGSADLDIVSGATITAEAYARSLQAILDGRG